MFNKIKSLFFVARTRRALKKLRKRKKCQDKRFKLLNDIYREEKAMLRTLGQSHALMQSIEKDLEEQGVLPPKT